MMKKTTLKKEPGNEQKVDSEELVQFEKQDSEEEENFDDDSSGSEDDGKKT